VVLSSKKTGTSLPLPLSYFIYAIVLSIDLRISVSGPVGKRP